MYRKYGHACDAFKIALAEESGGGRRECGGGSVFNIAGGTDNSPIKIRLIAPPMFVISTMALDKEAWIALVQKATDVILEKIRLEMEMSWRGG